MASPFSRIIERSVGPAATGADLSTVIGPAPCSGTVSKVEYFPLATITGAATDNRAVAVVNAGQAGSGTTSVATLAFGSGSNATGLATKTVTLSGTAGNLAVVEGDVLKWDSTHVGTGIADPGGLLRVTILRA